MGDAEVRSQIWWGSVNRPFEPEAFDRLHHRQLTYLQGKEVFVQDCHAGADPEYRVALRVITETAWHSLFARTMFIRDAGPAGARSFRPEYTVIHTPNFQALPEVDGTRSGAFIVLNFSRRLVLIGGTAYAGEIKKAVFTVMNYVLPHRKVLPMHCSANYGRDTDDVALFFGLSGTGKTTLSTTADRTLIGDDEHGWSERGVFNFEAGCYAKVIGVTADSEPEIYATTRRFGTILENVVCDPATRRLDLSDGSLTENTRAAYPLSHLANADRRGSCGHPKHIIFLTYDAFGVMPPVARLTPEQARFHFLCGYTSKVAGTEAGVAEPQATFSPCFGAPFMPLSPVVYADLLVERIRKHGAHCWFVNTGLTGGPYGVGHRMPLSSTRQVVSAILSGKLSDVRVRADEQFSLGVPETCPGLSPEMLDPRRSWSRPEDYDRQAAELAGSFQKSHDEFARQESESRPVSMSG